MEQKNCSERKRPMNFRFIRTGVLMLALILVWTTGSAQQITVKGRVVASDNSPLVGVTVVVKGTNVGTTCDINGNYEIKSGANSTLLFSLIGMKPQEIAVRSRSVINVTLEQETVGIDEVVVVGYGTAPKVNLSGAVDAISPKKLESRPITNLSQGLQGMSPNLNIDFTSGEPGRAANINIRGITSINGGSPLIIIDGIPADGGELNRLTPEDVANITVLKDASSAAIYGARAAFGVVLVTTKQGKQEGIFVSYNNNLTWSKPTILPDKTSDPYIYMRLQELSSNNTPWDVINYTDEQYEWARQRSDDPNGTEGVRINPSDPTTWQYMGNRDWTKYFMNDYNSSQMHNFQISGKTTRTRFFLSAAYDKENGALKIAEDHYKRYSVRSKVEFDVSKWLTIGNNTVLTLTERNDPTYSSVSSIYNTTPTSWDKNPDGSWANSEVGILAAQLTDGGRASNKNNTMLTTFTAEAKFFEKMLKVNADFTMRKGTNDYRYYYAKYNVGYGPNDIREIGTNSAYRSATLDSYQVFNVYGTFNKKFGIHEITSILGFNQEYSKSDNFTASRNDVITRSLPSISLATGEDYVSESYSDWAIRGTFYRLNYILLDRYIFEFNGRYDGSSRFPSKKRFGFFPSASAAWRVDQEKFFQPVKEVVSTMKIRSSYGSLGNQNVSTYGYIPTMSPSNAAYLVGDVLPQRVSSPPLVSDNYTWETVRTANIGTDLGFFKDNLMISFDMYSRLTTGMLTMGKDLPDVLGASEPRENAADLKTTGWEVSVDYKNKFNLLGKPLFFDTRLILSDNKAEITRFDNPDKKLTQYYVGYQFGEIWGLTNDGFFQNADEIAKLNQTGIIPWGALNIVPGWPKYKDLDDNKIIEKGTTVADPKDARIIGNTTPRYRFGANLNLEWNGFDISLFVQGIGKKDYYPRSYLYWGFYQQPYEGGYKHLMDFYRPTDDTPAQMAKHSQSYIAAGLANANTDAKYPILQAWLSDVNLGTSLADSKGLATAQTAYLHNAAYVRLKNITLGYTIPSKITSKYNIAKIRVFVSGENVAEWSPIDYFLDPEAATDNGYGYVYPFQRKYSCGINVNF